MSDHRGTPEEIAEALQAACEAVADAPRIDYAGREKGGTPMPAYADLLYENARLKLEHANALGTAAAEADARKRNLARAQELERQVAQSDVLYAQVLLGQRNLKHALVLAVEVIKAWHNKSRTDEVWKIYYDNAPEMKAIREALK